MATDTVDRRAAHVRGLTVTTLASLTGVAAALVSQAVAGSATDNIALYVVVGAIAIQFPVLKVLGIDVDDFSTKDYLYVAFMTFSLWFVSWGVLLSANTAISF